MNETLQTLLTRRFVRAFKPDMLPRETIDSIIEAGLYAPSGMNTQNTVIIAITDQETRDRLSRDNASVMGNFMLAAHALGVGSCWIHRAVLFFVLEG